MNGQGKLLTHYLKNADKLIIPVYQRNYDWREEHCKKAVPGSCSDDPKQEAVALLWRHRVCKRPYGQ